MPVLKNARHEKFAQELVKGKSADDAYATAGYKPDRGHASRLASNGNIMARIKELQSVSVERTLVTLDSLTQELEDARSGAMTAKQHAAAVTASMGKAKLHGLLIEKNEHTGKGGGPIEIDTLSDTELARRIAFLLSKGKPA